MKSRAKGFTMLDMMIGVILIAIVAVGSLEFYRYCHKCFIANSKFTIEALGFAKESMERLCWLDSSDPAFSTPLPTLPSTGAFGELGSRSGSSRTYAVSADKGGYKVLEVTVNW